MATGWGDSLSGGGMDISIIQYLKLTGRPVPVWGCIKVGFSVTTDSIGLEYTGVDWEAGPVFPVGGFSQAPGDVFYAEPDGDGVELNYLWYEEVDLGQDPGTWINGASTDLAELSDNLDALDSICDLQQGVTHNYCLNQTSSQGCVATLTGVGSPSASSVSSFTLVAGTLPGATTGLIFYGTCGPAAVPWGNTSSLCIAATFQRTGIANAGGQAGQCNGTITLDWNSYVATHPNALGVPFGECNTVWAQCWYRDPPAVKTTNMSSALRFSFGP